MYLYLSIFPPLFYVLSLCVDKKKTHTDDRRINKQKKYRKKKMETMKKTGRGKERITSQKEEEGTVRKGPWTMEEDLILFNYILNHGEGLWNSVAKASGICPYYLFIFFAH